MKPKFKLNKQEFKGCQTIKQVIEYISENKNLQLESFCLMDENQQLLTSANTYADLANLQEIHVYDLQDCFMVIKKKEKELHGEIGQSRYINAEKTTANHELYDKFKQFNFDNEITLIKYEKQLRKLDASNEITNTQLQQVNLQNQIAKKQMEFSLRQFNDENQIAKIQLEQQLGKQNIDGELLIMEFQLLLQQINDQKDIAKVQLEGQLQYLITAQQIANKNLQTQLLQQLQLSTVITEKQNLKKESDQIYYEQKLSDLTQQEDSKTGIENLIINYEQQLQIVINDANAQLEQQKQKFTSQIETDNKNFNQQISQTQQESENKLKQQQEESENKLKLCIEKIEKEFKEKLDSLQKKYDKERKYHEEDVVEKNQKLLNQKNKFETQIANLKTESEHKLSLVNLQFNFVEEQNQKCLVQLSNKDDQINQLKNKHQEKKNQYEKEKNSFIQEIQSYKDKLNNLNLQLWQLQETKQQNEQTIKKYAEESIQNKNTIETLTQNLNQSTIAYNQEKDQLESNLQNMKLGFEQSLQEAYGQLQNLQFQSNSAIQQGQQFYMQTVQLAEEKNGLEFQIQQNEKKYKQNIDDLEQNLGSVIEDYKKKLRSSKDAKDELETIHNKLIRDKNTLVTELEDSKDALQMLTKKLKTLESDYEEQKQKHTGNTETQIEQLKAQLREEKQKGDRLNIEIQKIPKLQKTIEQKEQELLNKNREFEEEKLQLDTQLTQFKKELQTITTKNNELQNQLQITKNQEQQLKDKLLKLNQENQEKHRNLLKEQEQQLKKQSAVQDEQLEELKIQIYSLKRQIKPVIYPKITGLIENFSLKFKQEYSKFQTYADIQTQNYDFELFAIQVDNQAEFDRSLLNSLNLHQLSKFISIKSLGKQNIKKTIQQATDSTFYEGNIFKIAQTTPEADNHDPSLKTKKFLMKTIKMLKNNSILPKTGEEGKFLLIPNLASMSILNYFIDQLKKKGVKPPAFKFPQQYLMQGQTENDKYFYHIEELVDGELLKFNSSSIPLKDTPEAQFSNSLVYYSFKKLHEKAMLTNIQGIKSADETITIYDTVFCSQQGLSSDIDLGNEEIVKMRDLIEKDGKKYLGDFYEKVKDEFKK